MSFFEDLEAAWDLSATFLAGEDGEAVGRVLGDTMLAACRYCGAQHYVAPERAMHEAAPDGRVRAVMRVPCEACVMQRFDPVAAPAPASPGVRAARPPPAAPPSPVVESSSVEVRCSTCLDARRVGAPGHEVPCPVCAGEVRASYK